MQLLPESLVLITQQTLLNQRSNLLGQLLDQRLLDMDPQLSNQNLVL